MSRTERRAPRAGVEWEFDRVSFDRDFSRGVVTRLLVDRAEHGGWELDRVRIGNDGLREEVGVHEAVEDAAYGLPPTLTRLGRRGEGTSAHGQFSRQRHGEPSWHG